MMAHPVRYSWLVLCHGLLFGFIECGMGKAFFARGGLRNNTGKSRLRSRYTSGSESGLAHATHHTRCHGALTRFPYSAKNVSFYFAVTLCLLVSTSAIAGERRTASATDAESTRAQSLAVERGIHWLAAQQADDGSYGSLSHYGPHVGITGLVGLAMMADGHMPGRGRYGNTVDQCLSFVLRHSSESGLLAAETSHGPMYGHGFATLFLAEVYGMTTRTEVRETLRRAVRLIVNTQNDEGGWRYQPVRGDADISVTICQVMALRAAKNVGIYIDKSIIDKATAYVKNAQNPDGGFRYMLSSGGSAFARSAAGIAALQYAGIYTGEEIERGLQYLSRFKPPKERTVGHYFYGHYYAAQAMYLAGNVYWIDWWPAVRGELIQRQSPEGFWRGQAGQEYGTAMALIILQMPNRLLPIFQK